MTPNEIAMDNKRRAMEGAPLGVQDLRRDGTKDPNNRATLGSEQAQLAAARYDPNYPNRNPALVRSLDPNYPGRANAQAPSGPPVSPPPQPFLYAAGQALGDANTALYNHNVALATGAINVVGGGIRDIYRGSAGLPLDNTPVMAAPNPVPPPSSLVPRASASAPAAAVPAAAAPVAMTPAPAHGGWGGYEGANPILPAPAPTGGITGLTRVIKTVDAAGHSVYSTAPDGMATPAGGTSRVYDAMGNRADVNQVFNSPNSVADLARQQDAVANPAFATAAKGAASQGLLGRTVADGQKILDKNSIYKQLTEGNTKPIDPIAAANVALEGRKLIDQEAKDAADGKRSDKKQTLEEQLAAATAQRDGTQAVTQMVANSQIPNKDGTPRGISTVELNGMLAGANTDPNFFSTPVGGAAREALNVKLREAVEKNRPKVLRNPIDGISAEDASKVSLANLVPDEKKPGHYKISIVGNNGRPRSEMGLSLSDLNGVDEQSLLKAIGSYNRQTAK